MCKGITAPQPTALEEGTHSSCRQAGTRCTWQDLPTAASAHAAAATGVTSAQACPGSSLASPHGWGLGTSVPVPVPGCSPQIVVTADLAAQVCGDVGRLKTCWPLQDTRPCFVPPRHPSPQGHLPPGGGAVSLLSSSQRVMPEAQLSANWSAIKRRLNCCVYPPPHPVLGPALVPGAAGYLASSVQSLLACRPCPQCPREGKTIRLGRTPGWVPLPSWCGGRAVCCGAPSSGLGLWGRGGGALSPPTSLGSPEELSHAWGIHAG